MCIYVCIYIYIYACTVRLKTFSLSLACVVLVAYRFLPTQPTCVWPACELRWTSLRESPSKSQCTSANSVKGLSHYKSRTFSAMY